MNPNKISDQVRGKTIRFSWLDGPTRNTSQDHTFHPDGTVEWQGTGSELKKKHAEATPPDRPHYAGVKVSDDVCLVSYLSESGYTLTVTLNFSSHDIVGIASNAENWIPVRGTFEVLAARGGNFERSARGEKLVFAGENAYVMHEA